jgi:hypothetical protein
VRSILWVLAKRAAIAALFLCCSACGAQTASRYLVAAAHPLAAEAGAAVLKRGGSAMDAAVAVQMMLGLVEPSLPASAAARSCSTGRKARTSCAPTTAARRRRRRQGRIDS